MARALCSILALLTMVLSGGAALRPLQGQGPPTGSTLQRVVFVHRHCARNDGKNVSGACDTAGCGNCMLQGELMLRATGEAFRERYDSILPREYLPGSPHRKVVSYSDGVGRCQQSASAFLKGLFAYNASLSVYPAIDTSSLAQTIDCWKGTPTYALRWKKNNEAANAAVVANLSQYISNTTLMAMAAEIGGPYMDPSFCALEGGFNCFNRVRAFSDGARAKGTLSEARYPLIHAHWDQLMALKQYFLNFIYFQWQHSVSRDGFFEKAGYPCHRLLDSMIASAQNNGRSEVLTEYSGHGDTLAVLMATMGNFTTWFPDFGTSLVFEVYDTSGGKKNTDDDSGSLFVQVWMAVPDQLPGAHPVRWYEYAVTCQDFKTGKVYTTTAGCLLNDLAAFAVTRRGNKNRSAGGCYAFPSDLEFNNCTDVSGERPTNPECRQYRSSCPFDACGDSKHYYMKADLSCNPLQQAGGHQ